MQSTLEGTKICSSHGGTTLYEIYVAGRRDLDVYLPCKVGHSAVGASKWSDIGKGVGTGVVETALVLGIEVT